MDNPKSVNFMCPFASSKMLSGLRSLNKNILHHFPFTCAQTLMHAPILWPRHILPYKSVSSLPQMCHIGSTMSSCLHQANTPSTNTMSVSPEKNNTIGRPNETLILPRDPFQHVHVPTKTATSHVHSAYLFILDHCTLTKDLHCKQFTRVLLLYQFDLEDASHFGS